jgi:hypothetical protein
MLHLLKVVLIFSYSKINFSSSLPISLKFKIFSVFVDQVLRHPQRQFSAKFSKAGDAPLLVFKDYHSLLEGFYREFPKLNIHHSLFFMYQHTPITDDDSLFSLLDNLDSHPIIILRGCCFRPPSRID